MKILILIAGIISINVVNAAGFNDISSYLLTPTEILSSNITIPDKRVRMVRPYVMFEDDIGGVVERTFSVSGKESLFVSLFSDKIIFLEDKTRPKSKSWIFKYIAKHGKPDTKRTVDEGVGKGDLILEWKKDGVHSYMAVSTKYQSFGRSDGIYETTFLIVYSKIK